MVILNIVEIVIIVFFFFLWCFDNFSLPSFECLPISSVIIILRYNTTKPTDYLIMYKCISNLRILQWLAFYGIFFFSVIAVCSRVYGNLHRYRIKYTYVSVWVYASLNNAFREQIYLLYTSVTLRAQYCK